MTAMHNPVKGSQIASIRNVALVYDAITRTQDRHHLLPGLAVFYGPSGYGKTLAANTMALKLRAVFLQAKSTWTKKHFLETLLRELSIVPTGTIAAMAEQAGAELARSGRPLILDEFDHMTRNHMLEVVRDIYESSQGTMLLIGEEMLPTKLVKFERFHGRVLNWIPAMPVDLQDAKQLAPIYSPRVGFADDVLAELILTVKGSCRRTCNNLNLMSQLAQDNNLSFLDLPALNKLRFNFVTGESPLPRKY